MRGAIAAACLIIPIVAGCAFPYRADCLVGIQDGYGNCAKDTAGGHQEQQLAAGDDAKCRSYGLQHGSSDYAACRLQLETARAQGAASDRAVIYGAAAQSVSNNK
jgi:hypothetical protein